MTVIRLFTPPSKAIGGNDMLSYFFSIKSRILLVWLFVAFFAFPIGLWAAPSQSFYLRVGSGFAFSEDTRFDDVDCHSDSPAALFGCSSGNDGRAIGAYGDFDSFVVLDLGFGYLCNEWLRAEICLAYRPSFEFDGKSNFDQIDIDFKQNVEADLKSFSGMVVGIVKPLVLLGVKKWVVEPLIIAGVGVSHNKLDSMVYTFPKTSTTTPHGSHTDFAWSVGVGFSYAIAENIDLELLYRYSDLGEVSTDEGAMTITRLSDNSIITDSIIIDKTEADLKVDEILFSVIYYFD